jgi:hypothetical protein
MPRHILSAFVERTVLAALPLAATACQVQQGSQDLAAVAEDLSASDMMDDLGWDNEFMIPFDPCEVNFPPVNVALVPGAPFGDGGAPNSGDCFYLTPCDEYCPAQYPVCCAAAGDGGLQLTCYHPCPSGRRPAGLEEAVAETGCAIGRHFGEVAHLEAASVLAFRALERELVAHGAPRGLVARAGRAAREEMGHARITARIARAHGATVPRVKAPVLPVRSLRALALENAVEGCVRETYGALVTRWQAHTAQNALIRRAMQRISVEETGHADLAWAVDAWATSRLGASGRRTLARAKRDEVARLQKQVSEPSPALVQIAGLPSAQAARALVRSAEETLWS